MFEAMLFAESVVEGHGSLLPDLFFVAPSGSSAPSAVPSMSLECMALIPQVLPARPRFQGFVRQNGHRYLSDLEFTFPGSPAF